jgi:DNA-binding PadR family transcriptional regulator
VTEITNAEAALLGLLSEKQMYPYQIEQEVKHRDMRFWTELSMSSIYKLLRKLEKEDLIIRKNIISPENRLRKLYTISNEGKKALVSKLEMLLSQPEHKRWRIDIGVYNSDLLSMNRLQAALKNYREALEEKIREYEELLKYLKDSGCTVHRFGVATRPLFLLKGEIQWVDSYLSEMLEAKAR